MNAPATAKTPPAILWWIVWGAIVVAVIAIAVFLPVRNAIPGHNPIRYLPIVPLALSSVIRWLVLPRFTHPTRAFPIFVLGIALAEGAATLGLFLVPELRATYLILALLGIAQFAPVFLSRYNASGFRS